MTLKFHALADVFPTLDGAEFDALVDDIKAHGLREPITLHPDGSILDGRSRYRACLKAGVDPGFTTLSDPDTAWDFIVSKNLFRRHLNTSQRAMVAAKLATMRPGARTDLQPSADRPEVSKKEAAQLLKVGERTVQRAKKVLVNGTPEVRAAVERGDLTVDAASKMTPRTPPTKATKKIRKKTYHKQHAALWRQLRDGLEKLNGLPDIETMVNAVPGTQQALVSRRLPVVMTWLTSFNEVWERKKGSNEK